MAPEKVEPLARWAHSLRTTVEEIEAQQTRSLPSPGLRCLCAVVQAVRLARVVRDGALVVAAGRTQARLLASDESPWVAMRLCGPLALRTGYTVGRASGLLLRASARVGCEGWRSWAAARALPRPSAAQLLSRAATLGRAALVALKEVCHDRS